MTPEVSGAWFDKISCFCFSEQHLGPDESAELPVVFFLDPRLEKDQTMDAVEAITLSYTLFAPANEPKPVALAPQARSRAETLIAAQLDGGAAKHSNPTGGASRIGVDEEGHEWPTRTPSRITIITSSIRARGRWSARSSPS